MNSYHMNTVKTTPKATGNRQHFQFKHSTEIPKVIFWSSLAPSPLGVRLCSLPKFHCVPNASLGFSRPYHCYSCLSRGSSFCVLLQFSLYSRHICWEDSSLFPPQRSTTKICTNKTNIYASAEICSPNSPLHEHTGRLVTGSQITQEVTTAVGCGDLAGFLITLGQTET